MAKFYRYKVIFAALPFILLVCFAFDAGAQCGPNTPSFTVDLRGKPDSVWYSTSVARADTCCGGNNCVEFVVSVDSTVLAIQLDVVSGAMPTGSLFYQIDCGPQTSIGTPLCLAGNGPFLVTFCKPGNNQNGYRITPITRPSMPQTIKVTEGCSGILRTFGFVDSTITWRSLSGSAYDSYLSCTKGCDSTYVTPQSGFPTYVDYQVCGRPACKQITLCDTIRVYFAKKLTTTILPDNPTLCWSDTAALIEATISGGHNPYKYLWNTGATGSKIYAKPGTYWVQVSDASVCSPSVDTVVVSKVSGASIADAGNDTAICEKSSAKLSGKVFNVPEGVWVGNGTFSNNADINATYTPTATEIQNGKAIVKLYTKGIYGCPEVSDEVVINIVQDPSTVLSGNFQLCAGSWSVPYNVQSILGNTYIWSVTGGTIYDGQGTNSVNINWGFVNNASITITEINTTGCSTIVTQKINLLEKPVPAITGTPVVCEYSATSAYSTAQKNASVYNWNVVGGNIISGQGTSAIKVRWGKSGIGNVSVKETTGLCDSTVYMMVNVMPRPQPVITGAANVCQYGNAENYFVGFKPNDIYKWTITGGNIVGDDNNNFVIVKWGGAGKGKATVRQINADGCDTFVSYDVNIHGRPLIGIIGDSGACEKAVKDYKSRDTNTQTLNEWLIDNGLPMSGLGGNSVRVNWANVGVGNIKLRQVSKEGCDTSAIKNVNVNNKPVPFIKGKDTSCAGNIETYEIGSTPGHQYKWIVVNGKIYGSDENPQLTVQWGQASTGYIFLTETNTKGCDTTVMAKVTVASYPQPLVSGPVKVCEEKGGYVYSSPGNLKSTYTWLVSGGEIESITHNSAQIKWNTEGNGYVLVRETNAYGCATTDTINVEIIKLKTSITSQIKYPCNPSPVEFKLQANDVLLNVIWDFGDGYTSSERNPTHIYKTPGTYTVRALSKSITECWDSAGTTIRIFEGPKADFDIVYKNAEKVFYNLDDSVQFLNTSSGALRYEWDFDDGEKSSYFHTGHIYKVPGNFNVKLKAYNELGCVDSITKTIFIDADIILLEPNAFTPSGNKVNEYFSATLYNITELNVQIYNRWGERVYESDKLDFKWDGKYLGEPVQQDVYLYIIKAKNVKGDPVTKKGTLMLFR